MDLKYLIFIFSLSILAVQTKKGKKCSSDNDCHSIQTCVSGFCNANYDPEPCEKRNDCLQSNYGYECLESKFANISHSFNLHPHFFQKNHRLVEYVDAIQPTKTVLRETSATNPGDKFGITISSIRGMSKKNKQSLRKLLVFRLG